MKPSKITARDTAFIGLGVATLIAGGFVIFYASTLFPFYGVKYTLMSPYMSMVVYIIISKVASRHALIYFGLTFSLIMLPINIYMFAAILLTTILSYITAQPFKNRNKRNILMSLLFSAYTGVTALGLSKLMIGGVFSEIPWYWVLVSGALNSIFGFIGVLFASKVRRHMIGFEKNIDNKIISNLPQKVHESNKQD
ncbi:MULTISPECIES: hypothetical protein [unclassified Fusibacter]|uniref:hypothetical protein n=1 Tax=unclassified Fusibacter TaxID=2624464 RepID=UPI0010118040|nr:MULTISPECIES: hypothetical protein [unclassified Fusibacter]MCK8058982.1 hypothetical protein [Fusibacter sp. A2]NPE22393.1 hypothetical protein [Fusibacter sp. A1]RXV60500.1 hypothetical protein DWB64_11145 [Fusibacter sp. A1]